MALKGVPTISSCEEDTSVGLGHTRVIVLNDTELYTLKSLILCYMNFIWL